MSGGPIVTILSFLLLFAILFFGKGVRFYTDGLWFLETGYFHVWLTELKTRFLIGGGLSALSFLWLWGNFFAARAARNAPRVILKDDFLDFPHRRVVLQGIDRISPIVIGGFALLLSLVFSGWWNDFLLFLRALPFGAADPVFNKDIGFYVFRMPFLERLASLVPTWTSLAAILSLGVYALQRDIQFGEEKILFSRAAQTHLALLGLVFFLGKIAKYQLAGYNLLYSPEGIVFGATYTDLHVRLPLFRFLQIICLGTGLLFLTPVFRPDPRSWRLPAAGAALWIATLVLGLGFLPPLLQRFRVVPNEIVMEKPYIDRNIAFTRRAYGLENLTEKSFSGDGELTLKSLESNRSTLDNVRLWDHRPLLSTFSQLQEIRTYYKFTNADNDRYLINDEYRQVMLSVRELDHKNLPSRIWLNEHLTYTHGYGLVMGPVNEVTDEGLPRLFIRDIPPVSDVGLAVKRPEIYFGELANDYVVVNTRSRELDYPAGENNVYMNYDGAGGIPLSHFFRKAAFALRFGTAKLMLSRDITPESRILFHRQITERIRRIAPFFLYDTDPYAVLTPEGRVVWIVDGYTWTDRYPYSQPIRDAFNYVRNSVKVTVDAYDGTVTFYAVDETDPVMRTYERIFPGLLKPFSEMPEALRAHVRYPQDLFEVQSNVYARYHMTDARVFYNQEDLWATPHEIQDSNEVSMQPYYTVMRLPGETRNEYILMLPFTPSKKSNLIAWMTARSDPPHYGQLLVYRFPKERLVYGPMQIEARIDQDSEISQQFTLWSQRGVQVLRGNLIVIPLEEALLYIEPVYLQAERGKIPELRRVIVAYRERIAMGKTLDEALLQIFAGWSPSASVTEPAKDGVPTPVPSASALAAEAASIFRKGQEALKSADWAAYGKSMKELEAVIRRMKDEPAR